MKKSITKKKLAALPIGGIMTMGMSGQMTEAARAQENPFGLVYQNAITKNEPGKVNIRPVTYEVEGIEVAANLYLPADYDETSDKKYAAVTVAHPNGASKEQVAGLYAQRLAELGYIAVAADARYQGASGGTPRRMAVRTTKSRWPSSAMSSGLRSSVQKAMNGLVRSVSTGARRCRSFDTEPSRISTRNPLRSFSRASSALVASCSVRIPAAI